jgi:hypothetical protein
LVEQISSLSLRDQIHGATRCIAAMPIFAAAMHRSSTMILAQHQRATDCFNGPARAGAANARLMCTGESQSRADGFEARIAAS